MNRKVVALAAVVLSVILIAVAYAVYVRPIDEMPVQASLEDVAMGVDDLPRGWTVNTTDHQPDTSSSSNALWVLHDTYDNASTTVGGHLYVSVFSFKSVDVAMEEYLVRGGADYFDSAPLEGVGDEAVLLTGRFYDPYINETAHIVSVSATYLFMDGNVVALLVFTSTGDYDNSTPVYTEDWMLDIVQAQAELIHAYDLRP